MLWTVIDKSGGVYQFLDLETGGEKDRLPLCLLLCGHGTQPPTPDSRSRFPDYVELHLE